MASKEQITVFVENLGSSKAHLIKYFKQIISILLLQIYLGSR